MLRPTSSALLLLAALPLLAGCNSNATPVASAPATAQRFPAVDMPVGAGCAAVIGRFEAVIKADYDTGNVNAKVYEQMQKELGPARNACAAGDDAGSRSIVGAVKGRHGYPAG